MNEGGAQVKADGNTDGAGQSRRHARRGAIVHLLVTFGAMLALSYLVFIFNIPNPNIILMTGLTFFTSVYGFGAGAVSSAVMVAYSMFFFSEGHDWVTFSPLNLQKLSVVALGAIACTLLIGNLKRRQTIANRKLAEMNRFLRIENQSLEEGSQTDALTGVRNRFALRRDYDRFENRYVHVMMLDLDDFKRANDTYGHPVGDIILKKAGQLLIQAFGANSCYRYGGDEFLIICVDMDEAVFLDKLSAIRQGMSGVYLNDKRLPAHFSAGYVYGACERSSDLRLMMHQADENLYQAKRKGRDLHVGSPFSRDGAERLEQAARGRRRSGEDFNELFPF